MTNRIQPPPRELEQLERLHLVEVPATFVGGGYCGKDVMVAPVDMIIMPSVLIDKRQHFYRRLDSFMNSQPPRRVYLHVEIRDNVQ